MTTTAPYGSWKSPITVEQLTGATTGLSAPILDGSTVFWLESRADQGGRSSLWHQDLATDGGPTELTPEAYIRSAVHEYGGGAFHVRQGVVAYSSFPDHRVYVTHVGDETHAGGTAALTPEGSYRYADLQVYPEHRLVLAVREDHHDVDHAGQDQQGGDEPVNTIVALRLGSANEDGGQVLCSGADFYSTPQLSADGRLAWVEWNHPNMPWDSTSVKIAQLGGLGDDLGQPLTVAESITLAGEDGESAVQPRWLPSGALIFVSDRSGWWNLQKWTAGTTLPLHAAEAEFAAPQWVFGQNPYVVLDDQQLICTWSSAGVTRLGVLQIATGELTELHACSSITALTAVGQQAVAVIGSVNRPTALVSIDLTNGQQTELRRSSQTDLDPAWISVARAVTWDSEQGEVHGWFYPPTNPDFASPEGTLPPLITHSHGGPTSFATASFDLGLQYWTSRGFAILDVNYGGSTGYGRDYRQRLQGNWGLVDVADCAAGAVAMGAQGLADPARLAIQGGSAGGYTTLRALTATDVFSAGVSLYGVGDLRALAEDTHKFESRYLDGLVGPYPEALETYVDRSPISHVDQLSSPILLLQGSIDKVVPPNQAEAMATAARAKGLPVAMIIFEGEGHGFRKAENIRTAIEAQLAFLGRVYGFTPADPLPALAIDNL